MGNGIPLPRALLLLAAALCLAGCANTQASRFYTLKPMAGLEAQKSPGQLPSRVSVGIAPVEIPDYLDRPQIVTRDGDNELKLAEFDRWAGSLSENIGTVLAENLALLLGSDRVFVFPRLVAEKVDFAVALRVLRLDCVPGDKVRLKAQWGVSAVQKGDSRETHLASFTQRLNDNRYQTMTAAIDGTLAQLSREIAREITLLATAALPTPAH
jgi:uncharacterized lipoprotein YmbA